MRNQFSSEMIQIEQDVLAKNDAYATQNRTYFESNAILALNMVSSPGSGKTTLLVETINQLKNMWDDISKVAVIEGDQQTSQDAQRIRETGVKAIQINTGKGCHLDAHMIGHAMEKLAMPEHSVLLIENVGNLVCPAGFDLGERHKVVVLSVTEGEDKPLKYPDMFLNSEVMLVNKIDLLPHLNFNLDQCIQYAKEVNPDIQIIKLSAQSKEGMDTWIKWIQKTRKNLVENIIQNTKSKLASLEETYQGV